MIVKVVSANKSGSLPAGTEVFSPSLNPINCSVYVPARNPVTLKVLFASIANTHYSQQECLYLHQAAYNLIVHRKIVFC